ncbi:hypothetical protein D9M68_810130 [compost metagenome]
MSTAIGLFVDTVFNRVEPGLTKAPNLTVEIPIVPVNGEMITERLRFADAVAKVASAAAICEAALAKSVKA